MKLSEVKKAGDQPIIILKKLAFEFLLQKECKLCIVVVFLFQIDFIRISHETKITNLTDGFWGNYSGGNFFSNFGKFRLKTTIGCVKHPCVR